MECRLCACWPQAAGCATAEGKEMTWDARVTLAVLQAVCLVHPGSKELAGRAGLVEVRSGFSLGSWVWGGWEPCPGSTAAECMTSGSVGAANDAIIKLADRLGHRPPAQMSGLGQAISAPVEQICCRLFVISVPQSLRMGHCADPCATNNGSNHGTCAHQPPHAAVPGPVLQPGLP